MCESKGKSIMKSLCDFIEIGVKCALVGDELLKFAEIKLAEYIHDENEYYEREIHLEECRIRRFSIGAEDPDLLQKGKCGEIENWQDVTTFVVNERAEVEVSMDTKCFESKANDLHEKGNSASQVFKDHVDTGSLIPEGKSNEVKILRDNGPSVHAIHEDSVTADQRSGKSLSLITVGGKSEVFDTTKIEVDTPFLKGRATETRGAINVGELEKKEGTIPPIGLPQFSQKETYVNVNYVQCFEINDLWYEFTLCFSLCSHNDYFSLI